MIKSLEIEGYRLLDQFRADLGPLTVVIGANATGKSTLQDFLSFLSAAMERPVNTVLAERGGIGSVLTAREGVKNLGWRLIFVRPPNNLVWSTLFPFDKATEIEYSASISGEVPSLYGAVPRSELLRGSRGHGKSERVLKLLEFRDGACKVYDDETGLRADFRRPAGPTRDPFSYAEQPATAGSLAAQARRRAVQAEGPSLLLAEVRSPARHRSVSSLRDFLAAWCFYPGFDVGPRSPIRVQSADVTTTTRLGPQGANLATVLHTILTRREHKREAEDLKSWLRSAYPDFDDFTVEPAVGAMGKVTLRWHDRGLNRDLWPLELSDGVLRFLCLAAALNDPLPSPLVVIDEPEVGLHPGLFPILADMLRAAAEQTQVLVTTHSPDLLNCFRLDDVAVMIREESRVHCFRPHTRPTLRKLLESVEGERLGDLHRSGHLEAIG